MHSDLTQISAADPGFSPEAGSRPPGRPASSPETACASSGRPLVAPASSPGICSIVLRSGRVGGGGRKGKRGLRGQADKGKGRAGMRSNRDFSGEEGRVHASEIHGAH